MAKLILGRLPGPWLSNGCQALSSLKDSHILWESPNSGFGSLLISNELGFPFCFPGCEEAYHQLPPLAIFLAFVPRPKFRACSARPLPGPRSHDLPGIPTVPRQAVYRPARRGSLSVIAVIEGFSLDSTSVKVHPDGTGAVKMNGPQAIGKSRGGWNTKIHLVAADTQTAITFALSPGNAHDAPHGRLLLEELGPMPEGLPMLIKRAYEGNETRHLVFDLGMIPVVPSKSNPLDPWKFDRELYKKRNQVERIFRRLKGFRRIFSRFQKLDVVFLAFLYFALFVESLRLGELH